MTDFSPIFSHLNENLHPVLRFLIFGKDENIEKNYFTREEHYLILRNEIFRHISSIPILNLYVSKNYILLIYGYPREILIIGINDDGRIFISGVEPRSSITELFTSKFKRISVGRVNIVLIPDTIVRRILGYTHEYHEIYNVKLPTSVRVQGDLIVDLRSFDNEEFKLEVLQVLNQSLRRIILEEFAREIRRFLMDIGFSPGLPEFTAGHIILSVPGAHYLNLIFEKYLPSYLRMGFFNIFEELGQPEISYSESEIIFRFKGLEVNLVFSYDFIEINLTQSLIPKSLEILKEILNDLNKFEKTTLEIGRHKVLLECTPNRLTIVKEILGRQRVITISPPILSKGLMVFRHPEHKEVHLFLPKPVIVRFRTIQLSPIFIRRLNKYRSLILLRDKDRKTYNHLVRWYNLLVH